MAVSDSLRSPPTGDRVFTENGLARSAASDISLDPSVLNQRNQNGRGNDEGLGGDEEEKAISQSSISTPNSYFLREGHESVQSYTDTYAINGNRRKK